MKKLSSPDRARQFLSWFCADKWLDELLGDLEEEFIDNAGEKGLMRARFIYYWEVFLLLRPHIWKRKTQNSRFMLKSYIRSAYRNLVSNKVYGFINISGLSIGITCFLLIGFYVYDELSYDKFFKDSERIHRIALERVYPTNTRYFGSSPVNLAPVILENYPEVESVGRLHRLFFQNQVTVDLGEQSFIERKYLFADEHFFEVFQFEFIEGDPGTALDNPDQVVLTESTAYKYFRDEPAVNRTFRVDSLQYIVSGVIKDVPSNSHFSFDLLGSIHSLPFLEQAAETNSWISPWLFTYVKLRAGVTPESFEAKLPQLVKDYGYASILRQLKLSPEEYPHSGNEFNYFLQKVEDIHLHSNFDVEVQANSNIIYVYLLSIVGAFILIISCINFINMATARSAERAKEVGVRKVLGSTKSLLIKQFLTESILISLIGMIIALILIWLLLPGFNVLVDKSLSIGALLHPVILVCLLLFAFFIGILAGFYPSIVISSISSAAVLKGKYKSSNRGVWLRNALIIFQFFVSVTMISGTLLLGDQMNFIRNKDLGFDKENVLIIKQAQSLGNQQEAFVNNLRQLIGVKSISRSFAVPGDFIGNAILNSDDPEVSQLRSYSNTVDEEFFDMMNIRMIKGRGFSREFNDSTNVVVNQTAAKELGYDDPIGRKLINPNPQPGFPDEFTIVGMTEDFHHHSLHQRIPPMVFFHINAGVLNVFPIISARIVGSEIPALIQDMEQHWVQMEDDQPFTYSFLNESLDGLYQADLRTGKIFSLFTLIAIVMACVGLFGLAAYVTQQRTKEIGVRKVLGASVTNILLLLSRDFTILIGIAFALSVPLVYLGVDRWLENFAYRTEINVLTILVAGLLTLIMGWLTISYYTVKIATLNPVKSLRNE